MRKDYEETLSTDPYYNLKNITFNPDVDVDKERVLDNIDRMFEEKKDILTSKDKEENIPCFIYLTKLFSDYDGNNIFVHLSLDDPRVCQRRYIKYMFNYCFITAKCNRMTALCENNYERNEKLLQGVGFT